MNNEMTIKVNGLTKDYNEKKALKGISFEVKRGEIFGFLGPNGAGKTTTIKIMTGQLYQTYGDVRVLGEEIMEKKNHLYKAIGVIPEKANLYERLTIYDNLALFCKIYNVNLVRIDEVLEKVNLLNEKRTQVKKLSKGMKQRLLIARGILHKPRLLILDEPTSGLDPSHANKIHDLLMELNKENTTIFMTTHNMEEADKLCNRVAFLDQGKIVALDQPESLKTKYGSGKIQAVLKENNRKIQLQKDNRNPEKIYKWLKNDELISIHTEEPSLADIFMTLTGRGL